MKKTVAIFLFFCIAFFEMSAQTTTDIQIKLSGLTDKACILAYYFGNKTYLKDTLKISNETIYIQSDSAFHPGMYCLSNSDGKVIMDFFIDKNEQHFSMTSSLKDLPGDMHIKNSENNTLFYQWIDFVQKNKHLSDSLNRLIGALQEEGKTKEADKLLKQKQALDNQADAKQQKFEEYPTLLVSRFMKAQQEVVVPEKHPDGTEMTQQQRYSYFASHYFDNLKLDDEDLLYTPIYAKKVEWYFNHLTPPVADSVIRVSKSLIEKAKGSFKTYQYMVWQATYFAESNATMGVENAFVYLIDHYYAQNDTLAIPEMRNRLMKRADELRGSLIGTKAPNMIMQDSAFQLKALYEIDADFVIIYFFDPDCGHCKSETDTLLKYYNTEKEKLNFDVFAVCSDTSMQKMKKYIQSKNIPWTVVDGPRTATKPYGTLYDVPSMPTMYMMDKNKNIIAKRLNANQMIDMIRWKMEKNKNGEF